MHLLVREGATLDDLAPARDLSLPPADFILLSFSDSDLASFRAADRDGSSHFINLGLLRHPISVDLFLEKTIPGSKAILLRLLGGLDYWRYGTEQLARACRQHGVVLAVLPGDGRRDPRLPLLSTIDADELDVLDALVRQGGPVNARSAVAALLRRARDERIAASVSAREERPEFGMYRQVRRYRGGRIALVFYRSYLVAGDMQPIDALIEVLAGASTTHAPFCGEADETASTVTAYFVSSLKAPNVASWLRRELAAQSPDVIVNATAFSARSDDGRSPLDDADCPVIQVAMASCSEEAWRASPRGQSSTDLAMHVVLPEIDGRIFAGAISFKERDASGLNFHRPHAEGIAHVADHAQRWANLRRKPRDQRKVALVLSTYPGRPDQIAHAVGLDTPESALRIARCLKSAGYMIEAMPEQASTLIAPLLRFAGPGQLRTKDKTCEELARWKWPLADYLAAFGSLSPQLQDAIISAWGGPDNDPAFSDGTFVLPVSAYGNLFVCLQPERGCRSDRKGDYHDPNLPPRHGYVAFYLWLRQIAEVDALIHLGAHGTLEWLPGKAVALSEACAPRALIGPLPAIYPFIVNDPGEAAQAKRRIAAVTIGHDTPPLIEAEPSRPLREVERLLDEYASADGLDRSRRDRLARDILEAVAKGGFEEACGLTTDMPVGEALRRVDAFICDVKELAIRDGLHTLNGVELGAILRALDGRFIEPGPSGAPSRGRPDVLPTGRNLYSIDPRSVPTPLACENGARVADALLARFVEDHGDWPRALVLDLWGSQTMRTGGEELATAFALLGVAPTWDYGSFRVSGFDIVPLAKLARPRVDVTLRISGLLRDMFPTQLALFHGAVQRVAALDEDLLENPLRGREGVLYRIFGAEDGDYGAGVSARIDAGDWQTRADLGESYLAASTTAYAGDAPGIPARAQFERRVRRADGFVHIQDHRETDVLSSLDFAAHEGGFAAAATLLGNERAAIYHGDASDPKTPRVRLLKEETSRVLHGRALSERWLEGQMRHGFRGAAEMARTIDSAFALAATAQAISSEGFEHLYDAYLGDPTIAGFLARENSDALAAIQSRFREAIARSLWKPRRNDVSALEAQP